MTEPNFDYDSMSQADFEKYLPDFFADGNGYVSTDPRLQKFLNEHPDCAALVKDLETIAEHARSLFEPVGDPSDDVWARIQTKIQEDPTGTGVPVTESGPRSQHGEPNQLTTGGSLDDLE